jgi:hypothetical protein
MKGLILAERILEKSRTARGMVTEEAKLAMNVLIPMPN